MVDEGDTILTAEACMPARGLCSVLEEVVAQGTPVSTATQRGPESHDQMSRADPHRHRTLSIMP